MYPTWGNFLSFRKNMNHAQFESKEKSHFLFIEKNVFFLF